MNEWSVDALIVVKTTGIASLKCYLCEDYEICFDSPLPN
jgi:hypothetical protein